MELVVGEEGGAVELRSSEGRLELARGHVGWVCEGVRRLRAGLIGEWCGGAVELLGTGSNGRRRCFSVFAVISGEELTGERENGTEGAG